MIIDEEPVSELTLEVINDGIEDPPKPDDESVVAPEHFVEQNQNVVEKPKIEKKKPLDHPIPLLESWKHPMSVKNFNVRSETM